jgi:iron(III) transport system substrate-binding protein
MNSRWTTTSVALACACLFVLVGALLTGCPRSSDNEEIVITITDENASGPRAITHEEILMAARSEAEVNWYTSMPQSHAETFARLFEEKHDSVKVRITRQGTFDIISRVEAELKSGQTVVDVIHVLDPAIFISLRKRGELYNYEPRESKVIPPQYKDPGYWTSARLVTICLAYNTEKLSEDETPKTWRDLLDERWADKIVLKDAQTAGSAYAQYYFLREKHGVSFWEQLAHQGPVIYKSGDRMLQALLREDVLIAGGVLGYKVYQYSILKGLPIRAVWPQDGVPVCLGPVGILRAAPHPNAGKLFVEYMLSQEGQQALSDLLGSYSTRPDVSPPEGWVSLSELNLLFAQDGWEGYLQKQSALRAEYDTIFNPESE